MPLPTNKGVLCDAHNGVHSSLEWISSSVSTPMTGSLEDSFEMVGRARVLASGGKSFLSTAVAELARLDGRYLSTEVASGFTGQMLAIGSTSAPARVLSVSYSAHRGQTDPAALREK